MPVGKTAKPFELASRTVMLYKFDGMVYVSDAQSTAYQYPMTDARLFKDPETGRVSAEVPLVSVQAAVTGPAQHSIAMHSLRNVSKSQYSLLSVQQIYWKGVCSSAVKC